jgi:myo-inositol-1(or 4)-monophosphatase
MGTSDIEDRLATAVAVACEAGSVARAAFERAPQSRARTFKGPQDYILQSDAEVERVIRARLLAAFPKDAFFGEEAGGDFGRDLWVVDPIDGTANFARGIPHFCISIAFVRDATTEIGVIYQPTTDEMYAGRRGAGATLNGRKMKVSGLTDAGQAMIEAGWSHRRPLEPYLAIVDRLFRAGAQVRRDGSGALGLAYTADGRIEGYCELHMNSWDALAGLLLIEEAGGWINDFLANDGLRAGNPVLGCTPALKELVAEAMGLSLRR